MNFKQSNSKDKTYCDVCEKDFKISIETKESNVIRGGKVKDVTVMFFTCPHCGQRFVVSVMDEKVKSLSKKYQKLMTCERTMTQEEFTIKANKLKKQITAEESMLQHLYRKQHENDLKIM